MGILSGVVSYLFGLCLNLLDAAIDGFLGALGFDLDTFESYFPAAKEYYEVIIGFAIGILFIMLVFQIFRNFGVMLDMEAEDPLKIVGKSILFFGMIISSRSIVNLILGLLTDPYAIFLNTASTPYDFELLTLATSMFTSTFSNPFMAIVSLILMIVLGWQFLKLTVECVERYIVFYFVCYCAPVVFATGAFKSTAQIFKSWCRMLGSQAVLLLLNIWSIKLFMSFMPVFENNGDDMVFHFIIGFAFLKFAQKADTLLRILGLNTASTGDMVRSLGGTIAGIAMAIKSATGMAKGVSAAAGKIFGGGASNATNNSGGVGNGGSDISGMAGGSQTAPNGNSPGDNGNLGGVTSSGISSAKQSYVNDVMNSARNQMSSGSESETLGNSSSDNSNDSSGATSSGNFNTLEDQAQNGVYPPTGNSGIEHEGGSDGNIAMESDSVPKNIKDPSKINSETMEGLSNLAHGMPHDKYDPVKKSFSGGGFPEFKGEDANIIGASQLTPANGFNQSVMKMADGSTGTVYQNQETGEAHVVQFASVDNGVVQGTISEINSATGQMGEDFAFKAVHDSVPGAESFSSSSVQVKDSSGGAYHVATGAQTSFFSSMSDGATQQSSGSAYTPGGTSKMAGNSRDTTVDTSAAPHSTFSSGSVTESLGESAMPSVDTASGVSHLSSNDATSTTSHISSEASVNSGTTERPSLWSRLSGRNNGGQNNDERGIHGSDLGGRGASIHDETPIQANNRSESSSINSGIKPPQNEVSRFSKNNPANVEVFRREHGGFEAFDKNQQSSINNVEPPPKT